MNYRTLLFVECPHCKYRNQVASNDLVDLQIKVITCDCDSADGCGKIFAFRPKLYVQVDTFTLERVNP